MYSLFVTVWCERRATPGHHSLSISVSHSRQPGLDDDDTWPGAFLWWVVSRAERALNSDAVVYHHVLSVYPVALFRIIPGLQRRQRLHRRGREILVFQVPCALSLFYFRDAPCGIPIYIRVFIKG